MKKPSNYNMRLAMANFVEYYFTKFNREIGKEMLLKLEVNHLVYDWNAQHVFPNYSASYVPTIPTLIVAGEYDHITPLYNFTLDPRFKNLINTHIVTINNAGHFPWLEQPEQTKQAISTFLSGL